MATLLRVPLYAHIHKMANINRTEIKDNIIKMARIETSDLNDVPSKISKEVVPVMMVNNIPPISSKTLNFAGSLANATSATIFTASSVNDTYITQIYLSMIKDATSTATDIAVTAVDAVDNVRRSILKIVGQTLTADSQTVAVQFPIPLKIARGSTITLTSDTAVANLLAKSGACGFEIPN